MCALCGVLGGTDHWMDAVPRPGVYSRTADPLQRRRERARRVILANHVLAHYQMHLVDWQGTAFVLSTATGKTEIVDNFTHLWTAAEQLSGRPCDPLDPALLNRLEARDD